MGEVLERLFELKDRYYDEDFLSEDEKLDVLRAEYDKLNLNTEFTITAANNPRYLICPDTEYEFPFIVVFNDENFEAGLNAVYDAVKEYYANSDFYDECTKLMVKELVALFLNDKNIPIVEFINTVDVETLNVRKLNSEI